MLVGLDDIAWHELEHAYGSAADDELADEAIGELYGSVVHQGSVYTATPAVPPFVLEIVADPAAHHRASLVGLVGVAAEGDHDGTVHSVLRQHTEQLLALLADDDEKVRESAAHALGFLDGVPVSRLRWDVEEVPLVRATILPRRLPARSRRGGPVARARAHGGAGRACRRRLPHRYQRVAVVAGGDRRGHHRPRGRWPAGELAVAPLLAVRAADHCGPCGRPGRGACAAHLGAPDRPQAVVLAAGDAVRDKRSLPAALVPLLAPLLAVGEIAHSGAATLAADELAGLAAHPEPPANPYFTDPRTAVVRALITLGDERWRPFAPRSFPGLVRTLSAAGVPVDDGLLALARTTLAAPGCGDPIELVLLLGTWGPAARAALPELTAILREEGGNVPARRTRVAAARLHWALEHDLDAVLPTVLAALRAGGTLAHDAATAGIDHPDLTPALEDLLADEWAGVATALWRLTGRVETAPAIHVLRENGHWPEKAIATLVTMRATDTADILTELAERERRIRPLGLEDESIATDEQLRERLREAAAALRRPGHRTTLSVREATGGGTRRTLVITNWTSDS